jgi:SAM-dependent methyltransferase
MTAVPVSPVDLSRIADNLFLSDDGIWVSPGHRDMKFLENDETDWATLEAESFWYRHRNICFVSFLKKYPPNGVLFEIGSGNGSVARVLQEAGHSLVAIEPTFKLAAQARNRGISPVVCSTLEGAQFKPGVLSNVGLFDVLEHISDDEAFLAGLRRLMPTQGRLYCAVPTWRMLWSREDEYAGHVRRYVPAELRRRIERAGFEIEYDTGYFSTLILPIFLRRSLPSLLGLRGERTGASSAREHQLKSGVVSFLLQKALDREISELAAGKRKRFGASHFVAARAV